MQKPDAARHAVILTRTIEMESLRVSKASIIITIIVIIPKHDDAIKIGAANSRACATFIIMLRAAS